MEGETATVYVIERYARWREMQRRPGERLGCDGWATERQAAPWLRDQVAARSGVPPALVDPCYAFVSKPPAWWFHRSWRGKWAVLKVRAPAAHIVRFDDHGYVWVLNTLGNGWPAEYLPASRADAAAAGARTDAEALASLERMFGRCHGHLRCAAHHAEGEGEGEWRAPFARTVFGEPQPRAFVAAGVTRDMVRKAWVYRGGRRLALRRQPRRS